MPRPRERKEPCAVGSDGEGLPATDGARPANNGVSARSAPPNAPRRAGTEEASHRAAATTTSPAPTSRHPARAPPGDIIQLAPNVLSMQHWDRLLRGVLYAASPRVDWASLLRRSFSIDVLQCPKCKSRLRVLAVITEREPITRILAHVGMPTEAPPLARARDPSVALDDDEVAAQLSLELG